MMASKTQDQPTSGIDVEGTAMQRGQNQAARELLQGWLNAEAQEQADTWMVIQKALDEDRLSDRSLFL